MMTSLANDAFSPGFRNEFVAFRSRGAGFYSYVALSLVLAPLSSAGAADAPTLVPSAMPRLGAIDQRFQSYNIEMVEITGGRFWRPYRSKPNDKSAPLANASERQDAHLFQYRPPIDLTNPRLRRLAAALGPAYVRISGTWANTTYFADTDQPISHPPPGFKGILTRAQWLDVVRFAKSADAQIVTSFAIGAGTRDIHGVWKSDQARHLLDYTHAIGGTIAAAEFMNEPNLPGIGGAPEGYDATAYGRDFEIFRALMKSASPETMILGPGAVGEDADIAKLVAASAPAWMHIPIIIMVRCRSVVTARARRMPRFRKTGCRARSVRFPFIKRCATASHRESRSGSRKPPMPRAAAIPGLCPFSTHSAISTSSGDWPGPALRW